MFCTNCEKKISNDEKFCPNCGTKIDYVNSIQDTKKKKSFLGITNNITITSKKDSKKSNSKITGIGSGLLFIVLIVALYVIVNSTKTSLPSSTITNETENAKGAFITLDEFNKIQPGMSYEEVISIIGGNGTLSSETNIAGYHTQIFTWYGGILGENANVTFQNGKVIGKAQAGLSN